MRDVGRAVLIGVGLGVLAVAAVIAAVVLKSPGLLEKTRPVDSVLLVVTCPNVDRVALPHIVDLLALEGGGTKVRSVDPLMRVTLPGTSFRSLRDAYPFKGARGVADAYARATTNRQSPALDLTARGWVRIVDAAGGIEVDIPDRMDVFDGTRLYGFLPGRQRLTGTESCGLMLGAEYLASPDRLRLQRALGEAAARAVAAQADSLPDMVRRGEVKTDLSAREVRELAERLKRSRPRS